MPVVILDAVLRWQLTVPSAALEDFGATAGVTLLHARHVLRRMQHVLLLLMGLFLFFWKGTAASQMSWQRKIVNRRYRQRCLMSLTVILQITTRAKRDTSTVRYETHFRILSAQVCDIPFRTPQVIRKSYLCLVKSYNSIRRSKISKKRLSNQIFTNKMFLFDAGFQFWCYFRVPQGRFA